MTKSFLTIAASIVIFYSPVSVAQKQKATEFSSNNLPNLGNSDQLYLSEQEANAIGDNFYYEALNSDLVIKDIELNLYLRSLIATLHNNSSFSQRPIKILMINNPVVNAFALPGNVIVVHSGLFLKVKSEAELVSVLAHEMAHLKQQHILRLFAEQKKKQPQIILAMLAAIILSSNTQVSSAALSAGIASSAQNNLDYTRKQEYEADRMAIEILLKAKYDPSGMRDFFQTLSQLSGPSSATPSEFLRTHPLNQNRISEVEYRIQNINTKGLIKNSTLFKRLQLKLRLQTHQPTQKPKNPNLACLFSLLKEQAQNTKQQGKLCDPKLLEKTEYLQREYANLLSNRQVKKAEKLYQQLIKKHPEHIANIYAYLKHLYHNHQYPRFIQNTVYFLQKNKPVFPDLYQLLSKAYSKTKQSNKANYFLAVYYNKIGQNTLALKILQRLLKKQQIDDLTRERIQTLYTRLKEQNNEKADENKSH